MRRGAPAASFVRMEDSALLSRHSADKHNISRILARDQKFHFHNEVKCPNIAVFSLINFRMERMDSMHDPGKAQR